MLGPIRYRIDVDDVTFFPQAWPGVHTAAACGVAGKIHRQPLWRISGKDPMGSLPALLAPKACRATDKVVRGARRSAAFMPLQRTNIENARMEQRSLEDRTNEAA